MDDSMRREIDARRGDEAGLLVHVHGPDAEAAEFAAERLIEHYARERKHGALLKLGETGRLSVRLKERAELAIVKCIPLHEDPVPGRQPKRYGILNDLAFDRQKPEAVRIAAGKKHVDRLIERIRRGDESAKTEINALERHRRCHRDVKIYAKNSLDAFEAAKDKPAKGFGKRPKHQPQFQQGQARVRGGAFVP